MFSAFVPQHITAVIIFLLLVFPQYFHSAKFSCFSKKHFQTINGNEAAAYVWILQTVNVS